MTEEREHLNGRPITPELWTEILEAFREEPGNKSHVARKLRVARATAAKAWEQGWPDRAWRPMKELLQEEQDVARLRELDAGSLSRERASMEAAELDSIGHNRRREEYIARRQDEERVVRLAQTNAMGILAMTNRLIQGGNMLAAQVQEQLSDPAVREKITPSVAVGYIGRITKFAKEASEAARLSMQMERLHTGEAEGTLAIQVQFSPEEAAAEIRAAHEALALAEASGVVDAGTASGVVLDLDSVGEAFKE